MGNPTGFMEFTREAALPRDPAARVGDWNEIYGTLPEDILRRQGARCMDCGVPLCHAGLEVDGHTFGCPIHNLIPDWNDLITHGRWREALDRLLETNNFPEFTGRICPAPCEGSCVLAINEPAVTIKNVEQAIIDRAFEEGWIVAHRPSKRTGKKVAIIGSGPAGLAAADQLNKVGHRVTVYERDDRLGGLLMYGTPNMKLEKWMIDRRIDLLRAEGIEFVTNAHVGVNVDIHEVRRVHDAVLLACGALNGIDMEIPGRHLRGVHMAMPYLTLAIRRGLGDSIDDETFVDAAGKDVVVIGAGDTGTDCIGTAIRQGCRSLVNFARKPMPPLDREAANPWPQQPHVYFVDYGHAEGEAVFGKDPRQFQLLTKEFVDDGSGHVQAVRTARVEWEKKGPGRFVNPREVENSTYDWPADLVLMAVGFHGPEKTLVEKLGLETDARTNVKAEFDRYTTGVEGVFVAGDMRRGASLIVWAIAEGRGAAREIDRLLMGSTELP